MLIALVIIIPILYVWGDLRNASSDGYQTKSTFESIISFFSGMGQSYKLIGYAVRYKGQLPGICYTFGGWIDRILGNSYEAFSVEAATKTNSFGTIMSYITIGYGYLVLHYGTGSSYIAEIYYDFGYMGLVILNFFLGYIFGILSKNKTTSVMKRSVLYMFFYFSITMPRAAFLTPFNQIISMSTIAAYIVVFGLSRKKKILRFGLSKYVRSL
jgi:oligosaccharide repeat unit polymerase